MGKYAVYKLPDDALADRVFTITSDNIDAATWKAKIGLGITEDARLRQVVLMRTAAGVMYLVASEEGA